MRRNGSCTAKQEMPRIFPGIKVILGYREGNECVFQGQRLPCYRDGDSWRPMISIIREGDGPLVQNSRPSWGVSILVHILRQVSHCIHALHTNMRVSVYACQDESTNGIPDIRIKTALTGEPSTGSQFPSSGHVFPMPFPPSHIYCRASGVLVYLHVCLLHPSRHASALPCGDLMDGQGRPESFFFFFLEGREGARTHEWGMMHHGGNTILQVYNPVVWTFLSLRTRQRGSYPGPKNNSFTGMWRERDRGREEEEEKAPLWSTYTMHNAKASPLSCIA